MYGLVGADVSRSLSAYLHENITGEPYELMSLDEAGFSAFMRERAFDGINVTMPYKRAAAKLCDEVDETATACGCVNTVIRRADGTLLGCNTDFFGLQFAISRLSMNPQGKRVLILGSGSTAGTAAAVCRAFDAVRVSFLSRGGTEKFADFENYADSQLIINATPAGAVPHQYEPPPVEPERFPCLEGVVDVVYDPLCTQLVGSALDLGLPAVGGLAMLSAQAAASASLFRGNEPCTANAEQLYAVAARKTENIVITGMPGAGKTTVGKLVAEKLGRTFLDTDAMVEAKAGRSVSDIFAQSGEDGFRVLEAQAVREAGAVRGSVIATGGGAVASTENRYALRQNGRVFFLSREISSLDKADRPLSISYAALKKIYNERIDIYLSFCDIIIENNATPQKAAADIWREYL